MPLPGLVVVGWSDADIFPGSSNGTGERLHCMLTCSFRSHSAVNDSYRMFSFHIDSTACREDVILESVCDTR